MDNVSLLVAGSMGKDFIPKEYIPKGKDEHYLRNEQTFWPGKQWRHLQMNEVERLVRNLNTADNWNEILVTDQFDPDKIYNTQFHGLVRIGNLENAILKHHDLKLSCGITNSVIVSCDIGDHVAIHNVSYLAHYIIGNRCIFSHRLPS